MRSTGCDPDLTVCNSARHLRPTLHTPTRRASAAVLYNSRLQVAAATCWQKRGVDTSSSVQQTLQGCQKQQRAKTRLLSARSIQSQRACASRCKPAGSYNPRTSSRWVLVYSCDASWKPRVTPQHAMATCSRCVLPAVTAPTFATESVNTRKYRLRIRLAAHSSCHSHMQWNTAWWKASSPDDSQLWCQPPPPPLLLLPPPPPPKLLAQLSPKGHSAPKPPSSSSPSPPLLPLLRRRLLLLLAQACVCVWGGGAVERQQRQQR